MNVLVCDDDQQIVDSIIEELKKKSEETHVALRFYGFSQPSQINLSLPYDIALLDIDMGETNGISGRCNKSRWLLLCCQYCCKDRKDLVC